METHDQNSERLVMGRQHNTTQHNTTQHNKGLLAARSPRCSEYRTHCEHARPSGLQTLHVEHRTDSRRPLKVASHYSGLAARSGVKNDSFQMSKLIVLFHCTMQSVVVVDKTAGTSFAFSFISSVYAYSLK